MNQVTKLLGALLVLSTGPAFAVKFTIRGDLNNRLGIYTNQAGLYSGSETIGSMVAPGTPISAETIPEAWADVKYRLGVEAETDDKLVKGVYMMEIGAIRFGFNVPGTAPAPASTGRNAGGNFSGDGVNVETRFAYLDFGVPTTVPSNFRVTFGLQPTLVNKYLWNETAMGVKLRGDAGPAGLTLSWLRGVELFNNSPRLPLFADADNFLARGDFSPYKDAKAGIFALYQRRNPNVQNPAAANTINNLLKNFGPVTYNMVDVGVDASVTSGPFVGGLDFIYQRGRTTNANAGTSNYATGQLDLSAFFAHLDLGVNFGPGKVTYTGWYASGDDTPGDRDLNNFIATDVDITDSIVLFEGGYTDDNYFTEAPYFLDKGAIFNKLAFDFKPTPKVGLGVAGMYITTAQDLTIGGGGTSRQLGTEIDAAVTYKLNDNLELGVNGGYLFAGDAMDAFEANPDGQADANLFRTTARARYTF